MAPLDDFDEVLERYHQALGEFMKGDPEPVWKLHSHRDDATLANPVAVSPTDGSRLLRGWQMSHRVAERAR
jgi:hypothetical protein